MKFSSGIKAVAGAVAASLLLVTAHPAQADPVTTPYTRDINTIAEQTTAYEKIITLSPIRTLYSVKLPQQRPPLLTFATAATP